MILGRSFLRKTIRQGLPWLLSISIFSSGLAHALAFPLPIPGLPGGTGQDTGTGNAGLFPLGPLAVEIGAPAEWADTNNQLATANQNWTSTNDLLQSANQNWGQTNQNWDQTNHLVEGLLNPATAITLGIATGGGIALGAAAVNTAINLISITAKWLHEVITHKKQNAEILAVYQKAMADYGQVDTSIQNLEGQFNLLLSALSLNPVPGGKFRVCSEARTEIATLIQAENQVQGIRIALSNPLGQALWEKSWGKGYRRQLRELAFYPKRGKNLYQVSIKDAEKTFTQELKSDSYLKDDIESAFRNCLESESSRWAIPSIGLVSLSVRAKCKAAVLNPESDYTFEYRRQLQVLLDIRDERIREATLLKGAMTEEMNLPQASPQLNHEALRRYREFFDRVRKDQNRHGTGERLRGLVEKENALRALCL